MTTPRPDAAAPAGGDDEPNEPASPACLLHEVDPAYAGFLAGEALAAALAGLEALEAEFARTSDPARREPARQALLAALDDVLRRLDDPDRIRLLQARRARLETSRS